MRKFNILVVGAGVAGLTCAGLLKKQGVNPTVVEKDSIKKFNKSGYMLGILPLGGRVMTALDLMENYFGASVEMKQYEVHKENGQLNHAYSLDFINRDYGSYRGIERAKLIDLLMKKVGKENVLFGTQVAEMKH
ncbi:MAG TPA: FAD-dependent oxidoreductase, partial [Sunxiuqinia sp.]|nr:FAD-dependent oxidoreductase [Sunxiuqinia sp.]